MSSHVSDEEQVRAREQARIKALIDRDFAALRAMLDESLVHVHTTGKTEDFSSYVAGVTNNLEFYEIRRGDLQVRIFGEVAIMTGPIDQRLRVISANKEMELAAYATQVWIKGDGAWKLASFHACTRQ